MYRSLMLLSSRESWMLVAKLSERPYASISVSPAEAIPPIPVLYSIHMIILALQVAHPAAVQRWLWQVNVTWQSAETRAARFAYPAPGAEPTVSSQPTALSRTLGYFPSNSRSITPGLSPPAHAMSPCCLKLSQARMALILVSKTSRLKHTPRPSSTIPKGYVSVL